jgi:micrococcal nuclease
MHHIRILITLGVLIATAVITLATGAFENKEVIAEQKVFYCVEVVDGDTIVVKDTADGQKYKVRYIGIDTPETVDPNRPVMYFGKEASAKNTELVSGKMVGLEKDISEEDRYGRLLRYVYVGTVMINAELVRLGYAKCATYPPDIKYAEMFRRYEAEAREGGRGLWSESAQ